jgi:hypothetical protein
MDAPHGVAAKVLGANALVCFGLSGSGTAEPLRRLVDHHKANGNADGPGWLQT